MLLSLYSLDLMHWAIYVVRERPLTENRRGCAAFMGRDVSKLKGKGGGKFKYMSEKDMLELASKFAPYRYVVPLVQE